jgi:hypothetical protein
LLTILYVQGPILLPSSCSPARRKIKDTPQPTRPEEPKVSDVKPSTTELANLVADNDRYLDLYKVTLSKWQYADRNFDRVLAEICIIVVINWILFIDDKTILREKVRALKAQLAPTDASKMLARERYQRAQNIERAKVDIRLQT